MSNINRKWATLAGVLLMAVTLGCASTAKQEGTGEYVDDTVITTKVKAAILNEPTLKSAEINVETFKGVVQLSGFVSSAAAEKTAVSVASKVGGVKSVKDDMRSSFEDSRSRLRSNQRHNCWSTEWCRLQTAVCAICVMSACV